MSRSPPLRFLILLLAGWSGLRAALLSTAWWTPPAGAAEAARDGPTRAPPARPAAVAPPTVRAASPPPMPLRSAVASSPAVRRPSAPPIRAGAPALPGEPSLQRLAWQLPPGAAAGVRPSQWPSRPALDPDAPRWSVSAWSFLRPGDSAPLAAGGMLGGSQAGARLGYRLNRDSARPLALAVRATIPMRRPGGAEAALGLDWQPSRRLPVHLLAERRQKLGREGRSAFGLTVYGGVGDLPLGRLRVDAYAQSGLVGLRSRDLFADGSLRLSLPLARNLRLGAGAWAAAQPGLARVDLGPQASLRLPLAGRNVTVAADWRQRLAGNARPGSGPSLTLSTDF